MLFAYNEDGTLQVVADLADAREHFQARDVESGAIRLFDGEGRSLTPVFPHRTRRRFLGLTFGDDPGPYDLTVTDGAASDSLDAILDSANVLMPNPWFADMDAIRAHLKR